MSSRIEVFVETERLVLRRLRESDEETLFALRADPEVTRYQSWGEFTREDARTMVADMVAEKPGRVGRWYQFGIAVGSEPELIGDCAIRRLQDAPHTAEIGYTIGRPHQRQGFGGEAISALLDYAFGELRLHRVIAITDWRNEASIRLLTKLGFRREGHFVEAFDDGGVWADEYQFGLLAREWPKKASTAPPPA